MSTATETLVDLETGVAIELPAEPEPDAPNEVFFTPEDLLAMPDGNRYELVDGQLVERNMGTLAGHVEGNLFFLLEQWRRGNQAGVAFHSAASYRCFPRNHVRKPDVSFIREGRLPDGRIPEGFLTIVPDLAVEVVSPTDIQYDVDRKVAEYLGAGVPLVWVINPDVRLVFIYRADGSAGILREGAELDGEAAVPGFRCAVADLFVP